MNWKKTRHAIGFAWVWIGDDRYAYFCLLITEKSARKLLTILPVFKCEVKKFNQMYNVHCTKCLAHPPDTSFNR